MKTWQNGRSINRRFPDLGASNQRDAVAAALCSLGTACSLPRILTQSSIVACAESATRKKCTKHLSRAPAESLQIVSTSVCRVDGGTAVPTSRCALQIIFVRRCGSSVARPRMISRRAALRAWHSFQCFDTSSNDQIGDM